MNNIIYAGKHLLTLTVSRHAHNSWELVYCTHGTGTFHFDDGDMPYKKGDVVVVPPYVPHGNSSKEGFTNIHINIADSALPFKSPTIVQDDSNQFLLQAFQTAYFHFNGDAARRRLLMNPCGELICCYLMCYHKTQPLSPVVEEIENHIIQNYPDCNYELDKYLQSFPFSYDYLRKLFKKELGVTPHKYLTDKRLRTAADMLTYSFSEGCNIAEISQQCGFREPLYFSRMFKKKYGVAPSFYIENQDRRIQENNEDSIKIKLD